MGKAPKKPTSSGGGGLDPTDVFNNLHGQVGKTLATKALATLAEKSEIVGKAYGKQLVYVARQDILPTPSPDELERLDEEIESLKSAVTEKKESVRQVQAQLGSLNNSLTNEEMADRIGILGKENVSFLKRLEQLRTGTRRVDPVEKAKVDTLYDLYTKEWKIRKKMCKEILGAITENLPQSPAVLMEELGMETDPVPKDSK